MAYAKITSETTDTCYTNSGGNEPYGQQPTFETETGQIDP